MSLFITSLNSGSNGNCYYVGTATEAVLIDVGISCREIEKRMKRLGLLIENVKAVFVSHEHSDHISGLPTLVKKYQLPVYITPGTMHHGGLHFEDHLIKNFQSHKPVLIGGLSVTAFPKFHDANDPYSFVISYNNICVGVFTDIGVPCQHLIKYFQQCHAAFLEANYDETMLNEGNYPYHLKKRINGGSGHLSNIQALELFKKHKPGFMSHLILAHLSNNNNRPQLVKNLFEENAEGVKIIIASRLEESPVYHIQNANHTDEKNKILKIRPKQLSLSFP